MEGSYSARWSILVLSGVLLLPALAFLWLRLVTPFDNGLLQPAANTITAKGLVVSPVDAPPAGLETGDLVTHVDGRSLDAWAQTLFEGVARPDWPGGETVRYLVVRDGQPRQVDVTLTSYPLGDIAGRSWGTIVFALVFFVLAGYVFARRPQMSAAQVLFLSASGVLSSTTWSLGLQVSDFVGGIEFWLYQFTTIAAFMIFWTAGLHFALLFPQPLPIMRRRWLLPAMYGLPYLALLLYLLVTYHRSAGTLTWLGYWGPTTGLHASVFLALTLVAILWQNRIHRQGVFRQQLRWLTWATLTSGGVGLIFYLLPPLFGRPSVDPNLIGVIVLIYPVSLSVAILRHNLFDIDTLLNRTMVYGALTALTVTIYIFVVSTLGVLLQTRGDSFAALVATGVVAVLFQPLRERLQRAVNRLMYGERDEPFKVLTRLGRRLEGTVSPDATLSTIVETVAQALKLPYVAVALPHESDMQTVTSYGRPLSDTVDFPLLHQNEPVGKLLVAPRAPDEPFSEAEKRLLHSIARQAGTAVHAARLTTDLQRSRRRLVTAREEERRRLRRDLHDGLGPTLAAHQLKLGSARMALERDTATVDQLLAQLEDETEDILAEIRRLVYDLRPPVLDQLGLVGAIESCAAQYNLQTGADRLQIIIDTPEKLPGLPAAVEVAAYRIVQEALANVVRHAEATQCQIHLACSESLHLTIRDDGRGISDSPTSGVGLASMRERAAELNGHCTITSTTSGGTTIEAGLPL